MTHQVRVTDRWRRISSGKYSRKWRHFAGQFLFLRIRSIIVRSLVSNCLVIKEKCIKMRSLTFGVRYRRNAMCGIAGLCLFMEIYGHQQVLNAVVQG